MGQLHDHQWLRWMLVGSIMIYMAQGMALGAATTTAGKDESPLAGLTGVLYAAPGALTGRILYPDGASPAVGTVVRVWDFQKDCFVCVTNTDRHGRYATTALGEGRYLAVYGDRVYVPVVTMSEAKLCSLDVMVPRGKVHFTPAQIRAAVTGITRANPALTGVSPTIAAEKKAAAGAPLAKGAAAGAPKLLPALLTIGGVSALAVGALALTGDIWSGDDRRPASPSSP